MNMNDSLPIPHIPDDPLPLYLQLTEKVGPRTDALVSEIKKHATSLDVEKVISLSGIFHNGDLNHIVFQVSVYNKMKPSEQQAVMHFLGTLFERFPNKFPSYIEADTLNHYWSESR